MYGVAERAQGRLVEGFAQGRVDVDGSGHVLQHRAHLQHLGEAVGQLRHVLADGLDAQQAVVGLGGCLLYTSPSPRDS